MRAASVFLEKYDEQNNSFDPDAICDVCGKRGTLDFMGDIVCEECAGLDDENYEGGFDEEEDEDADL